MIFHTAADIRCYELWYDMFYNSVKTHCPSSQTSFHFVGRDAIKADADLFSQDQISLEEIQSQYNVDEKSAKGYYCISRFLSIPCVGDHVLLCDIDLKLIRNFDTTTIESWLEEHPAINFCRLKFNGKPGGMMAMLLRKDICQSVRDYANTLIKQSSLWWGLDSEVRKYIYETYSVKNYISLYNIGTPKQNPSIDECLFVYHKKNSKDRHAGKDIELKSFKTV